MGNPTSSQACFFNDGRYAKSKSCGATDTAMQWRMSANASHCNTDTRPLRPLFPGTKGVLRWFQLLDVFVLLTNLCSEKMMQLQSEPICLYVCDAAPCAVCSCPSPRAHFTRLLLITDRHAVPATAIATRTARRRTKPCFPPASPRPLWWIAHPDSKLVATRRLHAPPLVRQPPDRYRRRGIWKRKSASAVTLCSVEGISRVP